LPSTLTGGTLITSISEVDFKGGFSVEFAETDKPRAASASVPGRFRVVSGGFGGFRGVSMGRFSPNRNHLKPTSKPM
jgi:hypothetical protein